MARLALLALVLAAPLAAQQEGATTTRRQKVALAPLVQSVCMRLELHLPSFSADDLETRVEKALHNQVTDVVEKRYRELVIELITEDLGLSANDETKVRYGPYEDFGVRVPDWPEAILGFDETVWRGRDKGAYKIPGVTRHHRAIIMHIGEADAKYELAAWIGREPSKDQERGLRELSDFWAERLERAFGIERKDRHFRELLESVFVTVDTERAVLGTLTKLRYLVRPAVREALQPAGVEAILECEVAVADRIERELADAEWWPELQADHRAMLMDPKTQRRALKDRIKAAAQEDDGSGG